MSVAVSTYDDLKKTSDVNEGSSSEAVGFTSSKEENGGIFENSISNEDSGLFSEPDNEPASFLASK